MQKDVTKEGANTRSGQAGRIYIRALIVGVMLLLSVFVATTSLVYAGAYSCCGTSSCMILAASCSCPSGQDTDCASGCATYTHCCVNRCYSP